MALPRAPFPVMVEKGTTYAWCACGLSRAQPWCDGSHASTTGAEPVRFVARRTERVWLCGCKRTRTAPLCDGAHNRLPPADAGT